MTPPAPNSDPRQLSYLKYILPLLPTLATLNWRPSLPAEPPSGTTSHLSASVFPLPLCRVLSSCDLRSVSGTRGRTEVVLRNDLDAVLVVVTSFAVVAVDFGDTRFDLASRKDRLGEAGFRRGLVRCACIDVCAAAGGSVEAGVSTASIAGHVQLRGRQSSCCSS